MNRFILIVNTYFERELAYMDLCSFLLIAYLLEKGTGVYRFIVTNSMIVTCIHFFGPLTYLKKELGFTDTSLNMHLFFMIAYLLEKGTGVYRFNIMSIPSDRLLTYLKKELWFTNTSYMHQILLMIANLLEMGTGVIYTS